MKRKFVFLGLPVMLGLMVFLSNCSKDDNTTKSSNATTFQVNASSSSVWKYFSLSTGDTIQVSNPDSSLAWDLAFQRYRIKTNGGKSGIGTGGAYKSGKKGQAGFDSLQVVPDGIAFGADDTVSVNVAPGQYVKYVMNTILYDWYDLINGGQTLVTKDDVFIIKTADGKYAKFWMLNYYSAEAKSGYPKFQYFYQADGSKNLK
jgi:hypothetical protein